MKKRPPLARSLALSEHTQVFPKDDSTIDNLFQDNQVYIIMNVHISYVIHRAQKLQQK